MNPKELLYALVDKWERDLQASGSPSDTFRSILDELLFHSSLRFPDYVQFPEDGEFIERLWKWLENVPGDRQKQTLLLLASRLQFIDSRQMAAVYRDAYRRIIVPWLIQDATIEQLLRPRFDVECIDLLRQHLLLSVTQSFSFPEFLNVNGLIGIRVPMTLGENNPHVEELIKGAKARLTGAIILEDFVGTGTQASKVLQRVRRAVPESWRLIFVPLIILEAGLKHLRAAASLQPMQIEPVLVVRAITCVAPTKTDAEPTEHTWIRSLARQTGRRVLEKLNHLDDPPTSEFGYRGSGALLVTAHNTPNNTLPMVCHKAPDWFPLFRRLHHSKDGLA